jgi:hypothetical protein
MKIVIVSNKKDLKRNYSDFIDSCDLVFRSGKLDNIESGLTGTRTDLALLPVHSRYLAFDEKQRHIEYIRNNVPHLMFFNEDRWEDNILPFLKREGLENKKISFFPNQMVRKHAGQFFTTTIVLLTYTIELYPGHDIFFLGDLSTLTRTTLPDGTTPVPKATIDHEMFFVKQMLQSGKFVPILEDDKLDSECNYSKPVLF